MDFTRATQRMVRRYAGGTAALAARMDMSPTTLSHKASPTYSGQFFSPEELAQLMDETGDNDLLNTFCAARDGLFMPQAGDMRLLSDQQLAAILMESSKYVMASAESRSEDSPGGAGVTPNELAVLKQHAANAIAAIQDDVRRATAECEKALHQNLRAA